MDDEDRDRFLARLSDVVVATRADLPAWALVPNHFHLLLRPREGRLSTVMRRLLSGYATTFNLQHKRAGHLFQNRYKSIVCEEEPYLLHPLESAPRRTGGGRGRAGRVPVERSRRDRWQPGACYLAVRLLGLASFEVGRLLGLGRSGVSRAAARGEQSGRREPSLVDLASGGVNQ